MTDQEKLDRVIEYLTESHLEFHGGYPYDHGIIEDAQTVIVASLDDSKDRLRTQLETYFIPDLMVWFDEAAEIMRGDPECEFFEAMDEATGVPE